MRLCVVTDSATVVMVLGVTGGAESGMVTAMGCRTLLVLVGLKA